MIFRPASMVNTIVINKSIQPRTVIFYPNGSSRGVSRAKVTVEMIIKPKMTFQKIALSTTLWQKRRKQFVFDIQQSEEPISGVNSFFYTSTTTEAFLEIANKASSGSQWMREVTLLNFSRRSFYLYRRLSNLASFLYFCSSVALSASKTDIAD